MSDLFNQDNKNDNSDSSNFQPKYLIKNRENYRKNISKLRTNLQTEEESFFVIDKIIDAYNKKYYAVIVDLFESSHTLLNKLSKNNAEMEKELKVIHLKASEECRAIAREYPSKIMEECQKEGVQIDSTSMHPRYTFCDRFITIEVDDRKYRAKAYTREGILFESSFEPSLVVLYLKDEVKRIFKRSFKVKEFSDKIIRNYKDIIRNEKKAFGDTIPIRRITTRLGKNQRNFRTDEFIIDLSKLIELGKLSTKEYKIELGQTKDDRTGILLYHFESQGYIGFITVKKEEKNG